jgi:hypothetical protein
MNEQGFVFQFNDQGIVPNAGGGYPVWEEVWTKVIIVKSGPVAIANNKGGRLVFEIKALEGPNAGKLQQIGLNVFHNDEATKQRGVEELACITHVTGRHNFNSTGELHNIPFYVLPRTSTSKPTAEYPNPTPRTNIAEYKDVNGVSPGKAGGGQPVQQQQPQFNNAPAQQPQVAQQPQFQQTQQPQFQQTQQPVFDPNAQPQTTQQPQFVPQQQQQPQVAQQPQQTWSPNQPQQVQQPGGGNPPWQQ